MNLNQNKENNPNWIGGKKLYKCMNCGREVYRYESEVKRRNGKTFCSKKCWSKGFIIDKEGYILIHNPTHPFCNAIGFIREHRLIMEQSLGRYLYPHEVVHH